jgi:hypothetical protein
VNATAPVPGVRWLPAPVPIEPPGAIEAVVVMSVEGPVAIVAVVRVREAIGIGAKGAVAVSTTVAAAILAITPGRRGLTRRNTQAARKGRYCRVFSKVQHGSPPHRSWSRGKRRTEEMFADGSLL